MRGRTVIAVRLINAVIAALMALSVAAPVAAARPAPGLSLGWVWQQPAEQWVPSLKSVAAVGATTIRTDFTWESTQKQRGAPFVFSRMDKMVGAIAAAGMRPWMLLSYSAPWANAQQTHWAFPDDPNEYAAYAAANVARYGSRGTFWTEHPELPRLPAQHFEVWNEQNHPLFLHDQATAPERYAALYSATRGAIKAVDPEAVVTVGGLVAQGAEAFLTRFVQALPGGVDAIDEVGYHPYSSDGRASLKLVRTFRETLDGIGLGEAPIALTEAGFMPGSPASAQSFDLLHSGALDPALKVSSILAYSEREWVIPGLDLTVPALLAFGTAVAPRQTETTTGSGNRATPTKTRRKASTAAKRAAACIRAAKTVKRRAACRRAAKVAERRAACRKARTPAKRRALCRTAKQPARRGAGH